MPSATLVKPEALVCLGATAAQALLGSSVRIGRDRGRPMESDLADLVMVTTHPSAILRQRDDRSAHAAMDAFVADLESVARWLAENESRDRSTALPGGSTHSIAVHRPRGRGTLARPVLTERNVRSCSKNPIPRSPARARSPPSRARWRSPTRSAGCTRSSSAGVRPTPARRSTAISSYACSRADTPAPSRRSPPTTRATSSHAGRLGLQDAMRRR